MSRTPTSSSNVSAAAVEGPGTYAFGVPSEISQSRPIEISSAPVRSDTDGSRRPTLQMIRTFFSRPWGDHAPVMGSMGRGVSDLGGAGTFPIRSADPSAGRRVAFGGLEPKGTLDGRLKRSLKARCSAWTGLQDQFHTGRRRHAVA